MRCSLLPCVCRVVWKRVLQEVAVAVGSNRVTGGNLCVCCLTVQVAAGACHSAAITAGLGQLYCWGWNAHGQCCTGSTDNVPQPQLCEALGGVPLAAVAAGMAHTVCASRDGAVYACGWNSNGQLGTARAGEAERGAGIEAAKAAPTATAAGDEIALRGGALQIDKGGAGPGSTGQAAAAATWSGASVWPQESAHEQQACVSSLMPELVQHPGLDEEHVVQVGRGLANG